MKPSLRNNVTIFHRDSRYDITVSSQSAKKIKLMVWIIFFQRIKITHVNFQFPPARSHTLNDLRLTWIKDDIRCSKLMTFPSPQKRGQFLLASDFSIVSIFLKKKEKNRSNPRNCHNQHVFTPCVTCTRTMNKSTTYCCGVVVVVVVAVATSSILCKHCAGLTGLGLLWKY